MYRAWFIYKKRPNSYVYSRNAFGEAWRKTIIDELMRQGHDPNKESISIFTRVHTIPVEKSVTGKDWPQELMGALQVMIIFMTKIEWKQAGIKMRKKQK